MIPGRDPTDLREHAEVLKSEPGGKLSFVTVTAFLLLWLPVGFAIGTLVLLGPVRWWANACRRHAFPPQVETSGVIVIIVLLVITTGLLTRALLRFMKAQRWPVRIVLVLVVVATAGAAYGLWLHPALLSDRMAEEESVASFTFGPYPTEERLQQLKTDGYAVISLLHPAVVPFEPQLLAKEREATARLGIRLIHVPMLPWVSKNEDAVTKIKMLLRDKSARYYVHCYFGTDRVQILKRIVEQSGASSHIESLTAHRNLNDIDSWERGSIYKLGDDGWITPYPTDEELFVYILPGQVRQVVALLDPEIEGDRKRIEQERLLLQRYDLPFELIPVKQGNYDPEVILNAVKRVRQLPHPFVVHAFFSPPASGDTSAAEAFLQAYKSGRPPLPPSLFREPLSNGRAEVVAPHVAVGPRPVPSEFRELARRGVRQCLYIGSPSDAVPEEDGDLATAAGLQWSLVSSSDELLNAVSSGGPYYVYGQGAAEAGTKVEAKFGPALPIE